MDWDVPFKPHAALRYVLQKNSFTLPVPQLTAFQMEPVESLRRPTEPQPCESIEALFATVTDPDSCRWGATVRKIESEMGVSDPGGAWCYPVKRKPLFRPDRQTSLGGKIGKGFSCGRSSASLSAPSQHKLFLLGRPSLKGTVF